VSSYVRFPSLVRSGHFLSEHFSAAHPQVFLQSAAYFLGLNKSLNPTFSFCGFDCLRSGFPSGRISMNLSVRQYHPCKVILKFRKVFSMSTDLEKRQIVMSFVFCQKFALNKYMCTTIRINIHSVYSKKMQNDWGLKCLKTQLIPYPKLEQASYSICHKSSFWGEKQLTHVSIQIPILRFL